MPRDENIKLHISIIKQAALLPSGSDKRLDLVNRSICGIIRAKRKDYNPEHY